MRTIIKNIRFECINPNGKDVVSINLSYLDDTIRPYYLLMDSIEYPILNDDGYDFGEYSTSWSFATLKEAVDTINHEITTNGKPDTMVEWIPSPHEVTVFIPINLFTLHLNK